MRRFKRLASVASAAVISFSTLLALGLTGVAHAATALYWCEPPSSDHKFSTAANWNTASDCTSGTAQAPAGGEDLVFDSANLSANTSLNNDIASLSVESMSFPGNTNSYTITGNAITLTGAAAGLTQSGTNLPNIGVDLTLTGNQTFTVANEMALNNALSGSGNITMAGAGNLDVVSSPSYTGTLTNATGILALDGSAGTFSFGSITITNGGTLDLVNATGTASFDVPLTISGDGSGSIKALKVDQTASDTTTFTGSITLASDVLVDGNNGTLNITGPLSGAFTLGVDTGQNLTLTINSSNNTSNTPNTAADTTSTDDGTAPDTPDTGFALAAAHPVVTLAITLASAATIFAVARTTRKVTTRR